MKATWYANNDVYSQCTVDCDQAFPCDADTSTSDFFSFIGYPSSRFQSLFPSHWGLSPPSTMTLSEEQHEKLLFFSFIFLIKKYSLLPQKLVCNDADCADSSIFKPIFWKHAQKWVNFGNMSVKKQTVARNLVQKGVFCTFSFTPFKNTRDYAGSDRSQWWFLIH